MSGQTNPRGGLAMRTQILLGLVATFALVGVWVRFALPTGGTPPAGGPASAPAMAFVGQPQTGVSPLPASPSGPVKISIMTTDTKAQWLRSVTDDFNKAHKTIAAGRPITVEVLQVSGLGEIEENLQDLTLHEPVLVSPGDISSIEKANQVRKDRGQHQIPTNDCPPIVRIPSGFAMWQPMAKALGWPHKPIGWKEIVELAGDPQGWARYGHPEWGQFTFGHSHPEHSTFGFNVLASLAYAAAGKTEDLTPDNVRSQEVVEAFRKVAQETFHYGTSTSKLLNLMVAGGPGYLHAATTSETAFLWAMTNQADQLRYPWAFIFPAEGTFWSDNPTCILTEKWVTGDRREAARIYRDFLLAPAAQEKAVEIGLRPVAPGIALRCPICLEKGTDPRITPETVPPLAGVSGETNAAIIDVFRETKKKATVALLLDTSSSMEGVAIKNAVEGAKGFLNRLLADDEIEAYVFSDAVIPLQPSGRVGDTAEKLSQTIGSLYADGSTALYDAVCTAVERIETLRKEDIATGESRLYAVVLLSDGMNTNSKKWKSENEMLSCLPSGEDVQEVKIYTIAYGAQADQDLLKRIATRTRGRTWPGTPENIEQIYWEISAEQ